MGNQAKLLYVDIKGCQTSDMTEALKKLPNQVYQIEMGAEICRFRGETCRALTEAVEKLEIQTVMAAGFAENIAQACFEKGIPYIVLLREWQREKTQAAWKKEFYAFYPCCYFFTDNKEQKNRLQQAGISRVFLLQEGGLLKKLMQAIETVNRAEAEREKSYIEQQREQLLERVNLLLAKKENSAYEHLYNIITDKQYETTVRQTTELGLLREMTECWKKEGQIGPSHVFDDITDVWQAQKKYLTIKHGLWRLENGIRKELCMEAVKEMCKKNSSGYLIVWIAYANLRDREKVIALLGAFMSEISVSCAVEALSYGLLYYPGNEKILLQKAECLMELSLWPEVLLTLQQIENPGTEIQDMIKELKAVLA